MSYGALFTGLPSPPLDALFAQSVGIERGPRAFFFFFSSSTCARAHATGHLRSFGSGHRWEPDNNASLKNSVRHRLSQAIRFYWPLSFFSSLDGFQRRRGRVGWGLSHFRVKEDGLVVRWILDDVMIVNGRSVDTGELGGFYGACK